MTAARAAWALAAFAALCTAATTALYLSDDMHPFTDVAAVDGFPVTTAGALAGALVGAVVVARYPRHRVGWLLCAGQAGSALGLAADADAYRTGSPAALLVAQVFGAGWALAAICAVFLLVPDGRLPSPRWRPVLVTLAVAYLLGLVPVEAVRVAGVFAMAAAAVAAAAALVLRLRRSTGPRHRQLRWIVFAAVLLAAGLLLYVVAATTTSDLPAVLIYPFYLGFAAVPICTGIAILRYRLYDIDVIISRAVVLAVLTAFVTIGYVTVVVVAGATLGTRLDRGRWPSLAVLVVVALAFQPLRRRVLRLADRLVYGQRAAPYEALADFSGRLARSLDPPELLPAMAEAVAGVVGAAHVRVSADTPDLSATWPRPFERAPDADVEVRDRSGVLGRIAVVMPPGRRLRPSERRLLDDVAAQAALALRNLALEAELRAQVRRVGEQAVMLEASRRRLLAARDEERRRTAAVIDREVIRHLRPIPDAVGGLDLADRPATEEALRRSEDGADRALDALREVTRGVYPALLTHRGPAPALRGYAGRTGRSGALTIGADLDGARFGERAESAAYFCAVALLADADALEISTAAGRLVLLARLESGPDETVVDRVGAAGGTISRSLDSAGAAIVRIELPAQPLAASAQTDASRSVPKEDLAT